jgi:EmrB/QacA subfamily drug resistance transporter
MTNASKRIGGLIALCLMMFIVTLDSTITNIALPTITKDFSTTLATSNWISTIYVLVISVFMIPAAKVADQLGRKKVTLFGLTLFCLGSLFCATAGSIAILIAMRALQGLSGAIILPVVIPLAVDRFGRRQANQVVAIIGAAGAAAAAAGPPIGGLLIHWWSWHAIFFVNVPIVLLALFLTALCFRESYDTTISKQIDYLGIILLTTGLFLTTFVLLKGYDDGWTSVPILTMIAAAIIALGVFISIDLRKQDPLMEFHLFRDSTFLSSTVMYFTCGFAVVIYSVIFNFYLENIRGFTPLHAGYIIMFSSLMVIIALPLGSRLAQQLNYRWVNMIGAALMAVGGLLLTQITYTMTNFAMAFAMAVLGFGFGLTNLSLVSAVQYIPVEKAGIASGMVNAARQLGTCLGIALLVGILNNNVNSATKVIRQNAYQTVQTSQLSPSVQTAMIHLINHNSKAAHTAVLVAARESVNVPLPAKASHLRDLASASEQLTAGNQKLLQETTRLAVNGSVSGARTLQSDSQQLLAKQDALAKSIRLTAQQQTLQEAQLHITTDEHRRLTSAFANTFWIALLVLVLMCPVAFWTDRRQHA